MSIQSAVGSIQITTGAVNTTFTVSGLAFQPKFIMFMWNWRDDAVNAISSVDVNHGFGFASATTERACVSGMTDDANATTASRCVTRNDCVVSTTTVGAALDALIDLNAINSDGFQLIVDDASAVAFDVHYLALGGTSITNAFVSTVQLQASTGNQSVTAPGFDPGIVLFGLGRASALSTITSHRSISFGAATSSTEQFNVTEWATTALTDSETSGYQYTGECAAQNSGNTVITRLSFVSMDPTGFTWNRLEGTSGDQMIYAAIRGGHYRVGNSATRTDANDIVIDGLESKPSAIIFASNPGFVEDAQNTTHQVASWSLGLATGTAARVAINFSDEDATATVQAGSVVRYDAVYANTDRAATPAITGLMDLKSVDSSGFTCVMDDTDPAASFFGYVAFGPLTDPVGTKTGILKLMGIGR